MEPAVERREHVAASEKRLKAHIEPQWSPPLKGGSTLSQRCHPDPNWPAAMEPAVERREHFLVRADTGAEAAAAMEPAVERREHVTVVMAGQRQEAMAAMEPAVERREHAVVAPRGCLSQKLPQWSPPLKGGSTDRSARRFRRSSGRNGARR